ncbi:hypothetical protein [Phenylobacterium sp. Root700]|uniref:hypothetical protein n=1 Tax=Phenylobacterium sp. Root700 TaxID=1736591 RepID=UPI0006F52422|nr:hypothetical protein [Phenylobacterium sp. Root700]KRB51054.1 hypothetical protein ASE02_14440 [Phenylobacterium sp. Root700]
MNPEFQRNLWLEASPRRIAWAGVVLLLIYGAAITLTRSNPYGALPALGGVGAVVFVVCAMIWGARASGNSILTEIADRTWDFQRLSALKPWAMTWGKLFGGASLAWLCGLTGLLMMVIAGLSGRVTGLATTAVFMLALAVLLQAISLGAALIGVRKARAEGRTARASGVLGGLIIGAILLSWVAGSAGFQRGMGTEGFGALFTANGLVDWGGRLWSAAAFRAVALTLFAAWAVIGAWRLMRLELQMQNAPVIWPAFLIFLAIFAGGFVLRTQGFAASLAVGSLVVALSAYAAAFAEPADRVRIRQFAHFAAKGDLARAAPLTPAPLAPLLIATLLVLGAFAAPTGSLMTPELGQAGALIAFLLRDLGVIALCRMGERPQRGDFSAVVALGLLYGVGGSIGWAVGQETGGALFAPLANAPLISLASGLAQAAVVWVLAAKRIGINAPPSAPASVPAT